MMYICYGMTKSASTHFYQLAQAVMEAAGQPIVYLGPPFKPQGSNQNYFNRLTSQKVDAIVDAVGHDRVVLKTHGPPDPDLAERISRGEIVAGAAIRDPREIALSMIDHGRRSRRKGEPEFSECVAVEDCLSSIDEQLANFRLWSAVAGVATYTFNQISFDREETLRRIAAQLGVTIDAASVARRFDDRRAIGNLSSGIPLRYRDMAGAEQQRLLDRYADVYRDVAFDTPAAIAAAERRPRGLIERLVRLLSRH